MSEQALSGPSISHLVLNVRDIEASHRFYTEALGFQQCGALAEGSRVGIMRFYRANPESHHEIALVQTKEESVDPETWSILATRIGINHIALTYGSRENFLARLQHLRDVGVEFLNRGNHGMTHSLYVQDPDGNGIEVLYDVPSSAWKDDVNAALNYYETLPLDGDESLQDSTDYKQFELTEASVTFSS
jgi:catechol-2,3-dioxygenase